MTYSVANRNCPNCLTTLELQADGDQRSCPVCQYAERSCPKCMGRMVKSVEAHEGAGIQVDGLSLTDCTVYWACQSEACGYRIEADF